jgi:hypothetical protein
MGRFLLACTRKRKPRSAIPQSVPQRTGMNGSNPAHGDVEAKEAAQKCAEVFALPFIWRLIAIERTGMNGSNPAHRDVEAKGAAQKMRRGFRPTFHLAAHRH